MLRKKPKVGQILLYGMLIAGIITELVYFYQVISHPPSKLLQISKIAKSEVIEEHEGPSTPVAPAAFLGVKHKALLEITATEEGPEAFIEEVPAGDCKESYRRKVALLQKATVLEPLCVLSPRPEISFKEHSANFSIEDDDTSVSGKMYMAQINNASDGDHPSFIYLVTGSLCDTDNVCQSYYALDYTSTPQSELSFAVPGHPYFVELDKFVPMP